MRSGLLIGVVALAALTSACGTDSSPAAVDTGDGAAEEATYVVNNRLTGGQDVELPDDVVAEGLNTIESYVALDVEALGGRFDGNCWMAIDEDGTTLQLMRCGPMFTADNVLWWRDLPFGAEADGDSLRITPAPQLEQGGNVPPSSRLSRPDGLEAPAEIKPGAEPEVLAAPELPVCEAEGTIGTAPALELTSAADVRVDSTVDELGLKAEQSRTQFRTTHVIKVWDGSAGTGAVLEINVTGVVGDATVTSARLRLGYADRSAVHSGDPTTETYFAQANETPEATWDIDENGGQLAVELEEAVQFGDSDNTVAVDVTLDCS